MYFSTVFTVTVFLFAGFSYAAKHLYVLQEQAGDDGLYHWRMLYGTNKPYSGTWYDVVWSDKKKVGMQVRSKEWDTSKSNGVIGSFDLGPLISATKLHEVVLETPTPQYIPEHLNKNCQTWVEDVVNKLIAEKQLDASASKVLTTVPKEEDEHNGHPGSTLAGKPQTITKSTTLKSRGVVTPGKHKKERSVYKKWRLAYQVWILKPFGAKLRWSS